MGRRWGAVSVAVRTWRALHLRRAGDARDGHDRPARLRRPADVSPHFQELTLTLALTTDVPEAELDELKALVLRRCPLVNLIKDAGVAIRDVWVVRPTA
ncbi:hypothetical protein V2J56_07930 [Georgenia sp. MJ206]|uniref:hypothetical protein n=1 Tax=Georgenia wangjunii TaxID=3117730 RepID=UPI002F2600D2